MSKTESAIAVTAKDRGYYGSKVREPGETFAIASEAHFSKSWMERIGSAPVQADDNTGNGDGGGSGDGKPKKLSAKERIAAAKELTGRTDITTAKEADVILAAAGQGGEPASDDGDIEPEDDGGGDDDTPVQADD